MLIGQRTPKGDGRAGKAGERTAAYYTKLRSRDPQFSYYETELGQQLFGKHSDQRRRPTSVPRLM